MLSRAAERVQKPRSKREKWAPLRAKRAEDFQAVEIKFGKLLLVYLMRYEAKSS